MNSTSKPNSISACGKHGHFSLQQHQEVNVCESTTLPTSVPPVVAGELLYQNGISVSVSHGWVLTASVFLGQRISFLHRSISSTDSLYVRYLSLLECATIVQITLIIAKVVEIHKCPMLNDIISKVSLS